MKAEKRKWKSQIMPLDYRRCEVNVESLKKENPRV
jgi:hypothetical protein